MPSFIKRIKRSRFADVRNRSGRWKRGRLRYFNNPNPIRYAYTGSNRPQTTMIKGPSIVPDQYMCKLKYNQRVVLTCTTGTMGTNVFRGNSLYDPDLTGIGQQPNGYDQLSGLYQKVRVTGSKVKVRNISQGSTNATSQYDLVLVPLVEAPSWSTIEDAISTPYSRSIMVGNSNTEPKVISNFISTKKIFGEKVVDDDDFAHDSASNPADQFYWYLSGQAIDRSSTVSVICEVSITYYCTFFQRQALNLS